MFLKSVIAVIGAVTVASLFGGVKSAPTAVTRDAGESLLYKTLTAQAFTLKWVMPEKATRATLSVTGDGGYSAVYADLTTTQQALELPAAPSRPDNEQIFTFTLAFDNGERFVAKLGSVCGVGDGAVAQTCGCRVVGTRLWERALSAEVVPVAAGMTDFTVALDAGVDLRLVGYNDNARLGEIPGRAFVKNSVYARKNGKVQLAFDPKIAFPNAAGNFGSFQVEVDVVGEGDPLIDRDEYVILDLVNGTKLVMKRIRAKDVVWTMGPAENDSRAMDSTYWSHPRMGESRVQVKLTKDYFMGIFELSQTQYKTLTGENPSFFTNVNSSALYPVENVPLTWSAMETKLKTRHDFGFRIPTEAQWEFAARAGYEGVGLPNGKMPESSMSGSTPVWSNLQELEGFAYSVGNTDRNVQTVVLSVGSGRPNAYGLYNTLCNVSEWVVDKPQRNLAGYYASSSKPVEDPRSTTAEGMYGNSYGMLKGGNFRQVQWWRYATRLATPDGQATYNGQPAWGWRLCADAE